MDRLLLELFDTSEETLQPWIAPGRYVSGAELAATGLAEMIELTRMKSFMLNGASRDRPAKGRQKATNEKPKRRGKTPVTP